MHLSSAETSSGSSSSIKTNDLGFTALFVNVTARSGTLPTLIVQLQQSPNGDDWYDVNSIVTTSLTSIITVSITSTDPVVLADYVRIKWTIGGLNPSFTFTTDLAVYSL